MQTRNLLALLLLTGCLLAVGSGLPAQEFIPLFNGRDLTGWEGDPRHWSVQDEAITGETTADRLLEENTFLIWKGGPVGNFELRAEVRLQGDNNSGLQYRSRVLDAAKWIVAGYQADVFPSHRLNGMVYEERGRGLLAANGRRGVVEADGTKREAGQTSPVEADIGRWNEYRVVAQGNHLVHLINGQIAAEIIDLQTGTRALEGVIALQLHAGKPVKVQFRNLRLRRLPANMPLKKDFATATPAEHLTLSPGFKAELLYTVPPGIQGSWVALAVDPRGGLFTSDQGGRLYHITPPPAGAGPGRLKVRELPVDIGHAHGLVWAFDSLYVVVNGKGIGGHGSGLYRVQDSDRDGELDQVTLLQSLQGAGEHGPHGVALGPDRQSLYVVGGNHTRLPPFTSSRVPPVWAEDHLLPQQPDARGHARHIRAPGGWICRTDPEGKAWEVVSIGYRNPYDLAFNADGELFTYDADMEWDLGTPWYRPTRINHVVSGSEFGWRTGTGKWPSYYPDSLPAVVEVGPGSPTGVTFGTGAAFPRKYREALFALDWTFGTIYAVHLHPTGATYTGTLEEFVSGQPLPVTDAVIGTDGAMYFIIGGRRTQSALYRVTYQGPILEEEGPVSDEAARKARTLRHQLESFHGPEKPAAVTAALPHLGHPDRFIRFAARVALEHQAVGLWQDRALAGDKPRALINAAVGLARHTDPLLQTEILEGLDGFEPARLDRTETLELLRAVGLLFIRQGRPPSNLAREVIERLDQAYPSGDELIDRELSQLLVYLEAPGVIEKTLALMRQASRPAAPAQEAGLLHRNPRYGRTLLQMSQNPPQAQQMHFAFVLRHLRQGWTLEQRREYFAWFDQAAQWRGGASYQGFLKNIKADALANTSPAERAALGPLIGEPTLSPAAPDEEDLPVPKGPGREWTVALILAATENGLGRRHFENGRRMYRAAACATCHRLDGAGGDAGPDLTSVAARFSMPDLVEAIVEPSKVISDQYASSTLILRDGEEVTGRIVEEQDDALVVSANPLAPYQLTEIPKAEILRVAPSPVSFMPPGLIDPLNAEEVLDLLAYLLSAGDRTHPLFRR